MYFKRKNDIIDTVTGFVQSDKILHSARPFGPALRALASCNIFPDFTQPITVSYNIFLLYFILYLYYILYNLIKFN